ncbi:MAG TPA: metal-dependent hydrolase [Candidatus Solibacter sp.]|jgi:inner membrane protein|nr:metal-dependent hydrolase [Candidatus Solibacter sp.]
MSPVTHFLAGWLLANTASLNRRDRAAVVVAAVIPDVDGLGAIPELLTRNSVHPLNWFSQYHHSLHTLAFALAVTLVSFLVARRRWVTALLVFLSFHLHLLGDLLGARGPDGYSWPIPYLKPFSNSLQLSWQGQWALNAWPNVVITAVFLFVTLFLAWKQGLSPLEFVSQRASAALVAALRLRFS